MGDSGSGAVAGEVSSATGWVLAEADSGAVGDDKVLIEADSGVEGDDGDGKECNKGSKGDRG
jgi:hypothetical protein